MTEPTSPPTKIEEENVHVEITYNHLDITSTISKVKSPKAGAIVLFAGKPHSQLLDIFTSVRIGLT